MHRNAHFCSLSVSCDCFVVSNALCTRVLHCVFMLHGCTMYSDYIITSCTQVVISPCTLAVSLHCLLDCCILYSCYMVAPCTVVHRLYRCTVYLFVALCSWSLHHVLTLHRWSCSGLFLYPTIFTDVTDDMFIAAEESFGPVMIISRFDDGSARTKQLSY